MTQVIDVQEVDHTPAVVGQYSIYRAVEPRAQLEEAQARAEVLVQVVKDQGLAQTFGGRKPHVQVEGWTFLASQFGLIPDIEWTRELEDGWEARARLIRISDGAVLTHAEAECRRTEEKGGKQRWKAANSYEIRSMAQTRATSKVCRNALSSVMVLAGFSATPAEEMDGRSSDVPATESDPHCPACRTVNGEIVGVFRNDRAPFWKCRNKPGQCAGTTEKNGRQFSWSGWHETWEASAEEWLADNGHAGPRTIEIGQRGNYWKWILDEVVRTLGWVDEDPGKVTDLCKAGLVHALADNRIDPEEVFGEPVLSNDFTEDQLRHAATHLTAIEAEIVLAASLELAGTGPEAGQ